MLKKEKNNYQMKLTKSKYNNLLKEIRRLVELARHNVTQKINTELLLTYWNVGRLIVEKEIQDNIDEQSARQLILELSKELTIQLGKGFSRSNLFSMRRFYQIYRVVQTVSGQSKNKSGLTVSNQLSWSHYYELLKCNDEMETGFYQQTAINESWSVRELRRQMDTALFERIALSKNAKSVMKLAAKGQIIENETDITKDPYVPEFLNIPENYSYTEKHLEQRIIDNLQKFILELGKGFAFIARQFRITLNNKHYHVDLVFYHRILKCFVLI